ncbi:MAG: hypothetical protein C0407_01110 [Desulfobacca sp.]|nr:hypothetical protein [Desulfobacca sp.]
MGTWHRPYRGLITVIILFLLCLDGTPAFSNKIPRGSQGLKSTEPTISVTALHSLAVFYRKLEKSRQEASWGKTASLWQEFEFLFSAFVGDHYGKMYSYDDFRQAYSGDSKIVIPFDKTLPEKDTYAYKMSLLGYSAKEISDVISGRITVKALDAATKMRQVGHSEKEVSNFLDGAYRKSLVHQSGAPILEKRSSGSASKTIIGPPHLDELAVRFSEKHGLAPQIIRAIIKAESNWVPGAVSKKGAIGLMQLMPGTAAILNVDPYDPEQNVEGGARYFSFLFDTFKDLDLALIAYNAGPGYAERYSQGKVSLYGETRQYVRLVKLYFSGE